MDDCKPTCGHEEMIIGATCVTCLREALAAAQEALSQERAARVQAEAERDQLERNHAEMHAAFTRATEELTAVRAERDAAVEERDAYKRDMFYSADAHRHDIEALISARDKAEAAAAVMRIGIDRVRLFAGTLHPLNRAQDEAIKNALADDAGTELLERMAAAEALAELVCSANCCEGDDATYTEDAKRMVAEYRNRFPRRALAADKETGK